MPRMTDADKQRAKSEMACMCLTAVRDYLGSTRGAHLMGPGAKAELGDPQDDHRHHRRWHLQGGGQRVPQLKEPKRRRVRRR